MSNEQSGREWTKEERNQAERITIYCLITLVVVVYLVCQASGMQSFF